MIESAGSSIDKPGVVLMSKPDHKEYLKHRGKNHYQYDIRIDLTELEPEQGEQNKGRDEYANSNAGD